MRPGKRLLVGIVALAASTAGSPSTMRVTATAYCDRGTTQSGTRTRTGIVAGDPKVLPVGTVLRILDGAFSGIYTVMDTGAAIKGRRIDIFIPRCAEAVEFGERTLRIRVLRRGWNPKATPGADEPRVLSSKF